MATRESPAARGDRRARFLRNRLAQELTSARRAAGISIREVARRIDVSHSTVTKLEHGQPGLMTIDLVARWAAVVGLELACSVHPNGDPVRDSGHLALLNRFRRRLPDAARLRTEVPMPIAGDLRSGDAVVAVAGGDVLIEAETNLDDLQAVERKGAAKMRDLGAIRLVLLVADTRHNQRVIRDHPELRERFPVGTRACLAALRRGVDPGGDCLVVL